MLLSVLLFGPIRRFLIDFFAVVSDGFFLFDFSQALFGCIRRRQSLDRSEVHSRCFFCLAAPALPAETLFSFWLFRSASTCLEGTRPRADRSQRKVFCLHRATGLYLKTASAILPRDPSGLQIRCTLGTQATCTQMSSGFQLYATHFMTILVVRRKSASSYW